MSNWYNWVRNSLGFSKMEANGLLILTLLMIILLFTPSIYRHYYAQSDTENTLDFQRMEELYQSFKIKAKEDSVSSARKYYTERRVAWNSDKYKRFSEIRKFDDRKKPIKNALVPFDINTADTIILRQVRGIGSVLSKRIIKYRNQLGGFTSKRQLNEVYGLKDSVLIALDSLAIIDTNYLPDLININNLDETELKRHPYINYKMAKAITTYRFQHGNFNSIDDLKRVILLDSLDIKKLIPYLEF